MEILNEISMESVINIVCKYSGNYVCVMSKNNVSLPEHPDAIPGGIRQSISRRWWCRDPVEQDTMTSVVPVFHV
jgi:hypothetical protein